MKTDVIDELQLELSHTPCSSCGQSQLSLSLRCDPGEEKCFYIVQCEHCKVHYHIGEEARAMAGHRLGDEDILTLLTCPYCGSHRASLHFGCELEQHTCLYTISCFSCGRVIREFR